jgi:DNA-binding transcriptional MocR family regulator
VALEDPVYPGARIAFSLAGARLRPIPVGEDGPDAAFLEERAKTEGIDLFYCCPTYSNPSGRSWSPAARERVLGIAAKYGFPLLEDDYLRDLDYSRECIVPLAAMAAGSAVRVIHVRTFSKCLLPALRIAGVSADRRLIDRLLAAKTADDICGSAFLQRPLARFLGSGAYGRHLERVRPAYAETREAVRDRAARAAAGLRFENPKAGLCLLGAVPAGADAERFAEACKSEGVLISLGGAYWAKAEDGAGKFRVGFGNLRPEEVERAFSGMERAAERAGGNSMEDYFKNALL